MYIYNMDVIDCYWGMIPLMERIIALELRTYDKSNLPVIHEYRHLKSFLIKGFVELKSHIININWDELILTAKISTISRPRPFEPYMILVFNQKDNKQAFMISEFEFKCNENNKFPLEEKTHKIFNQIQLLKWFEESQDLVDKIINMSCGIYNEHKEMKNNIDSEVKNPDNIPVSMLSKMELKVDDFM